MTLKNDGAYQETDEQQFLELCELAENVVKRRIEAGSSWNETEWEKTWNKENEDWDKVLLIPVSITYDNSTSSSGNKTMTGIQNDLKPGYAKLKGGPKENAKGEVESPLKIEVTYTSFNK